MLTHNHQDALPGFITPDIEVHTVRPDVYITLLAQISLPPLGQLSSPATLQAADCPGR